MRKSSPCTKCPSQTAGLPHADRPVTPRLLTQINIAAAQKINMEIPPPAGGMTMANIGIVFYSRTGTGRTVAHRLASITGWPCHEIRDTSPRFGLMGDLRCVLDSLLKRSAPIHYGGPPLGEFDHVVLIAPVWMRALAAPMRTFLQGQRRSIRAYSVICVMSGHGGYRAVDDMVEISGAKPRSILLLKEADVLAEECDAPLCRFREQTLAADGPGGWNEPQLPCID
ncbi:hypothetical protein LMG1873_05580 [Achromobacter piechaudii]|uniref:Flavodoxin domain-containing protein n=1 Tax=Achromobacter piechaudii TaxID=72556 RepID=A0ABN7F8E1_9BURK|nr:hypothetical protein LMG1873_05580 [Achromobacter piechaudii]CAB3919492.1 hypothetical protein LMG2828_05468 [Achromobacter piechaudii]CAB3958746.1 hypothetical protein LMG6103_05547 [Achromobacter piechaudii]